MRGLSSGDWHREAVLRQLEEKLPEYEVAEAGVKSTIGLTQNSNDGHEVVTTSHSTEVIGFRFRHRTEPYVSQFERQLFLLSRLKPYEDWERFSKESLRLWLTYREIVGMKTVERLGLRYVNVIDVPFQGLLSDYLTNLPQLPEGLPLPHVAFLYSDTMSVPESPYFITIRRTIQPNQEDDSTFGLIIDVDVFANEPMVADENVILNHLTSMRWLKNKSFFGTLTQRCIEELR